MMDKKYTGIDISEWRGKENNEIIKRINCRLRKLNQDSDWLADDNGPLTVWNVDKDIALLGDILRYVHDLEQKCIRIEGDISSKCIQLFIIVYRVFRTGFCSRQIRWNGRNIC